MFIFGDVSDEVSCNAVAHGVLESGGGRCDVLVNNAGIGHVGTILTTGGEDLDRLYAVNVKGVFHMTRAFLPAMIERQRVGGEHGVDRRDRRRPRPAGVHGHEIRRRGDHQVVGAGLRGDEGAVQLHLPGEGGDAMGGGGIKEYPDPKKAYEEMAATQAQKRMGRPEEIAAAALTWRRTSRSS